ncbi:MAG TPA: PTS sugar transporter subunit IIC [Gemmatimonadaceae bacterium]|nr:PTS sugar transporter subunit IIC [Gemmatimonadaceae bacterium]
MSLADILVLALLGGVLGLDTVSFPQAMLSRPIVAGTLAGAFLGAAPMGLLLGATLELFAVETLPFGASRYPEWGSSSVVGAALYVGASSAPPGALATSVLATLLVAWIGGWTMVQLRKLNAHWARQRHDAVARGSRRVVVGLQLAGLTADLLRGAVLTGAGLFALHPLQQIVIGTWTGRAELSRAVVAATAAAVTLGAAYKLFHAVPGFHWQFTLGIAAGLAAVVIL